MTIDGKEYKITDLAKQAGCDPKTIQNRHKSHPEWSVEELIQPRSYPPVTVFVRVEDEEIPLIKWAKMNGVAPNTVYYRWRTGERDPYRLVSGGRGFPKLSKETLEFLTETRSARAGMEDEWEIACDLAGIARRWAPQLKILLEGARA